MQCRDYVVYPSDGDELSFSVEGNSPWQSASIAVEGRTAKVSSQFSTPSQRTGCPGLRIAFIDGGSSFHLLRFSHKVSDGSFA